MDDKKSWYLVTVVFKWNGIEVTEEYYAVALHKETAEFNVLLTIKDEYGGLEQGLSIESNKMDSLPDTIMVYSDNPYTD